jgi:hypothetical protein
VPSSRCFFRGGTGSKPLLIVPGSTGASLAVKTERLPPTGFSISKSGSRVVATNPDDGQPGHYTLLPTLLLIPRAKPE